MISNSDSGSDFIGRKLEMGQLTAALDNVLVTALDVLDSASISAAVAAGLEKFGQIDALLNNAGYGAYGPLEAFPMDKIRRQFDTNVIGLLEVTKAVLPHMRGNTSGTIVNVSSIGGQMTFPLGALYHGTKFAVEGISEALHFELAAAGIKVKIVEPGMIATDFGGRSFDFVNDETMTEYQPVVQALFGAWGQDVQASEPEVVADVIWNSVTDGTDTLRYRAGADAEELLARIGSAENSAKEVLAVLYPELAGHQDEIDGARPFAGLEADANFTRAPCCNPLPGERIVGITYRGTGVVIHAIDCPVLAEFEDSPDRWIDLHWREGRHPAAYSTLLDLTIRHDAGVLGRICSLIGSQGANISNLEFIDRKPDFYRIEIEVELVQARRSGTIGTD